MASVFTKIIRGELPSYKILENDLVIAFLARESITLGHTLVVPKVEIDHFLDVPEPHYTAVFAAARTVGQAIHLATGSLRVGAIIAGWDVPHFHYHLVPMNGPQDLDFKRAQIYAPEKYVEIQARILENLGKLPKTS